MESHSDADAQWRSTLEDKADSMRRNHLSDITAGAPGEAVLSEYTAHGVSVTRRPDDEHGIARVSIGGRVPGKSEYDYCVFRGSPDTCVALLENAIEAIRAGSTTTFQPEMVAEKDDEVEN